MDLSTMDVRTLTLLGSGLCTMASMHFTSQLIGQHLFYWKNPSQQKLIIIIICMAPLYAMTSFCGLAEIKGSEVLFTFLHSIKECYEALVRGSILSLVTSEFSLVHRSKDHRFCKLGPRGMTETHLFVHFYGSQFFYPCIKCEDLTG